MTDFPDDRGSSKSNESGKPALQYAYKLLSYRGRSEKELAKKLKIKGFEEYDIKKTLNHLKENNLLDDRKLAVALKRYAAESKHLGIRGTKRLLMERGVPTDIVEDIVGDIDETEIAARLVEKKLKVLGQEASVSRLKKLYGVLLRRGHSYETIRRIMRQFHLTENIE